MKIDLTTYKDKNIPFDFSIPAGEINLEDETVVVADAVKIRGKLSRETAQTDVGGEISTVAEVECSRCLKPVRQPLEFAFTAAYVTPDNYTAAREVQVGAADLEVAVFAGDSIDLTELAREQILLAIPAQVFCGEDCKGLCQKCGANKNLLNCSCEEKEPDPRWAALKDLQ